MIHGSIKPSAKIRLDYNDYIIKEKYAEHYEHYQGRNGVYLLEKQKTYVIKLNEKLSRELRKSQVYGQATAKSSVGRVDVLARLIVNGMGTYESFNSQCLEDHNGDMYLEITPMTFNVMVKSGTSLSQLRLCYGKLEQAEIGSDLLSYAIGAENCCLTVDLENENINGDLIAAFCTKSDESPELPPIPLWDETGSKKLDPHIFWKPISTGKDRRLIIKHENFYILKSKQKINLPPGVCIYCKASDETIGEMRIHYAGFVHPWWGHNREDGVRGTPLIFEVRGHQVDVSLGDDEKLANLKFYRMSENAPKGKSGYDNQTLKLSGFFDAW